MEQPADIDERASYDVGIKDGCGNLIPLGHFSFFASLDHLDRMRGMRLDITVCLSQPGAKVLIETRDKNRTNPGITGRLIIWARCFLPPVLTRSNR